MPHAIQAEVRLSRLVVSGFRCLTAFDLRLEPATTVLVGENNCGKTSVLLAIDTAIGRRRATADDLHRAADDSVVSLATIDIFVSPPERSAVFSDEMRRRLGGVQREPSSGDEVVGIRTTLRRSGEGSLLSSTRVFLQPTGTTWVESPSPTVQQQAVDLLAAHLLASSRDLLEEMGTQTSAWGRVLSDLRIPELPDDEHGVPAPGGLRAIEIQLSQLASQVRNASPVLSQLHSDLGTMAGTQATVERVELVPIPQRVEDLGKTIEVVLHQQNAAGLPLRFHGSGSRSLAALLVFKTLCSLRVGADMGIRPHLVTLLEEPEAHLHPQAVAALLDTINTIPGQRIVSTHSATMVAEIPPASVRLLRRTSAGLTVRTLTAGDAGEMEHFRRYFGRPFGELVFARVAIICDGIAECNAYPVLLEMALGVSPTAHGVSFVDGQSLSEANRINKWLRVLHSLGIPWLYCADNDQQGDKALARTTDPATGQPLTRAHAAVASLQGTSQTEQMLIDAGFQAEITAVALEDGVTADDDAARLNFLKRNKAWANEAVARRANAAGRTPPPQLAEVVSKLRAVLGLPTGLPTQVTGGEAPGTVTSASAPTASTSDLGSTLSSASPSPSTQASSGNV